MAQSFDERLHANMLTPADETPPERIASFVRRNYGWDASVTRVSSERDELFFLERDNGQRGILRLANSADSPETTDLQVQALQWIEECAPKLPVPRIVKSLSGNSVLHSHTMNSEHEGALRSTWLSSWLDGIPLCNTPRSQCQMYNVGQCLAQLGLALETFKHPGASQPLNWDLQHVMDCRGFLPAQCFTDGWRKVFSVFDTLETRVVEPLRNLRHQIIHADLNWIGPYISRHLLSLNPLLVRRRRYSRGERYPSALCGCHSL